MYLESRGKQREILKRPGYFLLRTLKGFHANQGFLLSGAVAYYTLLSLIPLFTLLLIALSHVADETRLLATFTRYLEFLVPGESQAVITQIKTFLEHREVLSWVMLGILIFFSSLAFAILENAMSVIFFHRVAIQRRHFLISALMPYLFILLLAIGFTVVTLISGVLQHIESLHIQFLGWDIAFDGATGIILYLLGLSGQILMLSSIYLVMPVGKLSWRQALLGGVTAGLLWEVTRHALIWYFSTLSLINVVYGSLATAIIALLSLEIAAMILLFGAQVIAEYERFGTPGDETEPPQGLHT